MSKEIKELLKNMKPIKKPKKLGKLGETMLRKLVENGIYPCPIMTLSAWISVYVPGMFPADIVEALADEEAGLCLEVEP